MLEKVDGVIVALPFGDTGTVVVRTSKKDALTKEKVEAIIAPKKNFSLVSFTEKKEAKTASARTL